VVIRGAVNNNSAQHEQAKLYTVRATLKIHFDVTFPLQRRLLPRQQRDHSKLIPISPQIISERPRHEDQPPKRDRFSSQEGCNCLISITRRERREKHALRSYRSFVPRALARWLNI